MCKKQGSIPKDCHCYLPLERFHIVPVYDVNRSAIEKSIRDTLFDREQLNRDTLRNCIAKKFGIKGGYAAFVSKALPAIKDFKSKYNLIQRANLVTAGHEPAVFRLSHRQLADRIFRDDKPKPERVFTGYDVDWQVMNDRRFFILGAVNSDISFGQQISNIHPDTGDMIEMEKIIEWDRYDVRAHANFLGELLLSGKEFPDDKPPHMVEYQFRLPFEPDGYVEEKSKAVTAANVFRRWILRLDKGWVNVLPFNKNLVFLSSSTGEYDFVVRGQRDKKFNHNIHDPYLKNADTPKSNDLYHFLRWLYFEYDGWLEKDSFEAETAFYTNEDHNNYPGMDEVLRRYFINSELYSELQPPSTTDAAMKEKGFYHVCIAEKRFWVSNLISIRQFKEFMECNPEYAEYSRAPELRSDMWEPDNSDSDESLPASVTWYDANAYAAWISKEKHIPVRLLDWEEYFPLADVAIPHPPLYSDEAMRFWVSSWQEQSFLEWTKTDGAVLDQNIDHHREPDTQLRYVPCQLKWFPHNEGLRFLSSVQFGEWLNKPVSAAVNTALLSAFMAPNTSPVKDGFAPSSTGRYKKTKIGFRLCCSNS